jgi:hypothetical protein
MASIEFSGGDKLQAVLEGIAKRAGKAKTLDVGFMSGATYPDGTPVAMVAAIQNYGAPAAGIPARPFFSNMVREKSPGWGESLGEVLKDNDYDSDAALKAMGLGIEDQLQQAIRDTNSPALAEATVDRKGFNKPLIDTGHLLNSVQSAVDGEIQP